jgi:hypothetical protein
MKYTLISLILVLTSCEKLPLYIREFKVQEAFSFDINEPNNKPSIQENLPNVRGTDTNEGKL